MIMRGRRRRNARRKAGAASDGEERKIYGEGKAPRCIKEGTRMKRAGLGMVYPKVSILCA